MKKPNRNALELLFPYFNDPAYQALGDLEELIASFVPTNSTSHFKQRLQRAIARISEALVEFAGDEPDASNESLLFGALRDCRKAGNAVIFLSRGGVFARETRARAFELLSDIVQLLIDRIHALRGLPRPLPLPRPTFEDALPTGVVEATSPEPQNGVGRPPGGRLDG
jgi:hypothetical protein